MKLKSKTRAFIKLSSNHSSKPISTHRRKQQSSNSMSKPQTEMNSDIHREVPRSRGENGRSYARRGSGSWKKPVT